MFNYNQVNNTITNQSYIWTNELRQHSFSHDLFKKEQDMTDSIISNINETYEYIIEGGFIKIYLVENGIKKQCLKSIPLKEADASLLAKVQNLTMLDVMVITDMIKEEKLQNKDGIGPSKAIIEYTKHFNADDDINTNWLNL